MRQGTALTLALTLLAGMVVVSVAHGGVFVVVNGSGASQKPPRVLKGAVSVAGPVTPGEPVSVSLRGMPKKASVDYFGPRPVQQTPRCKGAGLFCMGAPFSHELFWTTGRGKAEIEVVMPSTYRTIPLKDLKRGRFSDDRMKTVSYQEDQAVAFDALAVKWRRNVIGFGSGKTSVELAPATP